MNYIIGSRIFKIILYRDINFNKVNINLTNFKYTLGSNN